MKEKLFTLILLCGAFAINAQTTAGLIAHWDMNGTTNDVSGGGHNGNGNNLTAAVGEDGVLGHAWAFNGLNSSITIPYSPAFNVSGYSIVATVMVKGFYSGFCHENMIFGRGTTLVANGIYFLEFNDFPYGNICSDPVDTAYESFVSVACSATASLGAAWTEYNYFPYVMENQWYTVVATFNDTVFNLYINTVLKSSVASPTPGMPIGTSTDSASIGYDTYEAGAGNSYAFNGIIDDIRLYDRALTDSEVVHINDTCGSITLQPVNTTVITGGTATYTVNSTISGAAYQWQQNSGTGYVNLSNAGPYSGVTTNTLTVTGITAAMSNYLYRCLLSNSWGCADTTSSAALALGMNNVLNNENISVYPNPAGTQLTISAANRINSVSISDLTGQVVFNREYNVKQVQVNVTGLPGGVYFIKINGTEVRKFIKQ